MKRFYLFLLTIVVATYACTTAYAQGMRESFPEGSVSPVTNINRFFGVFQPFGIFGLHEGRKHYKYYQQST